MRKRVMMISEFSELSTGYSIYAKNLLKQLYQSNKYEVAEMACYCSASDPRINSPPWRVYPVVPHPSDIERTRQYESDPFNAFGKGVANQVFLDWKPDYVLTIFDAWYTSYLLELPSYHNSVPGGAFSLVWSPTCDSINQKPEWLDLYMQCDALLSYTDWSRQVLEEEGRLFTHAEAPACGSEEFCPGNKAEAKKSFGISPDTKVITMVSRNQRRKLFPDLINTFGEYIAETGREDIILLLHTSYPDNQGWDLPRMIMENGLSNKVLSTYMCECGNVYLSHFCGGTSFCDRCRRWSGVPSNVGGYIPDSDMARILNATDLAVLHSNSEGQGIFTWQAAGCAVPICEVNYSAMASAVDKMGGYKVDPISLMEEIETGCKRAVPNNEQLKAVFHEFFSLPKSLQILKGAETRQKYVENYSWEKTSKAWMDVIDKLPVKSWDKPPIILEPAPFDEMPHVPHSAYAQWLIREVARQPERSNTMFELKLIGDMENGVQDGKKMVKLSRRQFYDRFAWFRGRLNELERARSGQ
jgi:glycosyltransferase involved in cell wall biosynthesis